MVAALDLHKGYPANKAALAGKQPGETPFQTPVEIPQLADKYKANLDWEGKVVQSCVHCHMIGAALQTWHRQQRKPLPEPLIYPFPEPETIGLTLASEAIAQVEAVAAGSIAEKAGLKAGDQITVFAGQPLISIADVSWALHRMPNAGSLDCIVSRAGAQQTFTLDLPQGWRRKSDVTRRVSVWPERGMALGGMRLESHEGEGLGLKVRGVGQYGMHAAAKKAGFKEGDVLLRFGEVSTRITEGELLGLLLQKHFPGDRLSVTVQRGSERKELVLPMQ
jgi:membrane-associated protease RseP (regulator of RpoE activity)